MRATLFIILVFLASCAGGLHPVTKTQQPEIQSYKTDNATVFFNYLGKEGQMMIFDVEIKNTSDETIHVDPGKIRYKASFKPSAIYTVSPLYCGRSR